MWIIYIYYFRVKYEIFVDFIYLEKKLIMKMLYVIRKSIRNVYVCYIFYKDKYIVNYDLNEYKFNSMVVVVLVLVIVCNIGYLIVYDL